ncbi:MAG: Tad domain-containing protein [Acidimicrobiia bacterium]|nr:Tad domain-containing protein [Acidimicrobiia bacterium]
MYRLTDDEGAVAIVVAIFAVGLIGMAAFALDTGAMYQERRELQNGADASALAIAEDCLITPVGCTFGAADATADAYGDSNADDGASTVDELLLDPIGQSVTVRLQTEDAAGGSVLAPIFGQVLGFDGATVAAEAKAVWGYAGAKWTVPLIISDCEWFDPLRPAIQDGPPFASDPWLFVFHQGNQGRTCDHSNSGFDLPGGFGWLDANSSCQALFTTGSVKTGIDPGSSPSNSCTPEHIRNAILNKPSSLPYYSAKSSVGNQGSYEVSALGGFWITGYNFGGSFKEPSTNPPCSGTTRCIEGYFIDYTSSDGDPGGPDRGSSIVKLIP